MPKPPPVSARRFGLEQLVHPPMRADARRNYDALLAAADELFATHGPDVALDEIARRAGVGNATLYRHFPDRRDLLVAVCVGEVRALCLLGEQLDADPDAGQALTRWLRAYITHVSARHGLAAAFATGRREDSEFVAACQTAVEAIGTSLLKRSQDGGMVRTDIGLRDVITLVNAIAMATETTDESEADRMLAIVLAGIAQPRKQLRQWGAKEGKSMIEVLPDMPKGVTGVRVSGRLQGDELRELKPTIEEMLQTDEIRIVEVIAPDYEGFGPGGLFEDLKLGFGTVLPHHSSFKRIAVVSDKAWVAHTVHALAWLIPGELAVFRLDELERAKEWAAG